MALENSNTLDIVLRARDGRANGIDLLLFDHGSTTDEVERYNLLTRKLGTYVAYVMSDDFRRSQPMTKATDVRIFVLCKNPPNSAMQAIEAVFPRGDRVNRVAVSFENLDEFMKL